MPLYLLSDAFGDGGGGRGAAVHHYDELLAPVACHDVVRPDRLTQGLRHADKRLIPGGMRVLIVVGLEVVDAKTMQAKGIPFSRDRRNLRSAARRKKAQFGRTVRSSRSAERRREVTSSLSDLYRVTTAIPASTMTSTYNTSSITTAINDVPRPEKS